MAIDFVKAHAYGNDFLFMRAPDVPREAAADVARAVCDRHAGVGADGLILFQRTARGASMTLLNADGSKAELSGNGVRCLGAILLDETLRRASEAGGVAPTERAPSNDTVIETDGGTKTLTLLSKGIANDNANSTAGTAAAPRYTFRAFMGAPENVRQLDLDVSYESIRVIALSVGNPQCVVLTERLDEAIFRKLGPELAVHEAFPDGTNVEFVEVERPDRIRILIWERGVGPTTASRHGRVRVGRGSGGTRRGREVHGCRLAGRFAACRVERRRDLPDRVGRDHRTRYVARVLIPHARDVGVGFAYPASSLARVIATAFGGRPGLPVVR